MILTVTPNAAIDRTLRVADLVPGARHRLLGEHAQAGGKGVNVARVLTALGSPARAVVVIGGASGARILADLRACGIPAEAVHAPGDSRTCLEIVEDDGRATQIHGDGVLADAGVAARVTSVVDRGLAAAAWLAVCGSLARGLPVDTAARLVAAARRRGVPVAVDTSGAPLAAAWREGPTLVRVNRAEASQALPAPFQPGHPLPAPMGDAAEWCVVSDGPRPVWLYERAKPVCRAEPPAVRVRNPIGCGDAMLAGLLHARAAGRDWPDALREGVALAAADAESEVAGRPDPARAQQLLPRVRIELAGAAAS